MRTMPIRARTGLAAIVVLGGFIAPLAAQAPFTEELVQPAKPIKQLTKKDLDQRESLKEFAIGHLCEREDRLLAAVEAFGRAAKLDPTAIPVLKALVILDLALDR